MIARPEELFASLRMPSEIAPVENSFIRVIYKTLQLTVQKNIGDPDRMRRGSRVGATAEFLEKSYSFEPIRKSVRLTINQRYVSTDSLPPSQLAR